MKRPTVPFPIVVLIAAFLFWGSSASATTLAILDLRFTHAAPALKEQVQRQLWDQLLGFGYKLVDRALVNKRLEERNVAPGCTLGPCLARVGRVLKADRVVVGGIAGLGTSYDIVLTMLETGGGSSLAQVTASCDVCTFADVGKAVARATTALHRKADKVAKSSGWVVVRTRPAGARVQIDRVPVGAAPLERLVAPGRHVVEVVKGHHRYRRVFVLAAGETERVSVNLGRPVKPPAPARLRTGALGWTAWGVLGAGVGLLGASVAMLAIDGSEKGSRWDRRETFVPGVALLGGGAAATALSGVLFWLDRRSAEKKRASRVAILPGGVLYTRSF